MYPIRGLIDIRAQLYRNSEGGPQRRIPLAQKRGGVLHYSGDRQNLTRGDLDILMSESAYHAFTRDWDDQPDRAPFTRGDGLMYHIIIGRNGEKWLGRALEDVLWHCGTSLNSTGIALHVPIGGDQRATPACLRALGEVVVDLEAMGLLDRSHFWGHVELGTTGSCPGALMDDFVYPWREGAKPMADGMWFPQTEHYIGGGFWRFWRANGGLPLFGYPISDEEPGVCEDGQTRTVQWFERARFEYHPDAPDPYKVQLTRLGAQARKAAA